jgi:hypothetical protein
LPCPEPIPLPTRFLERFAPLGGFNVLMLNIIRMPFINGTIGASMANRYRLIILTR